MSDEHPLKKLLSPASIAFVGASNNPAKMGTMQAASIVKDGYQGRFYPLHRTEKSVLGFKAYSRVEDLPEAPDLVMFVSPAPTVAAYLEEFGKIGTRSAIVISAGFREVGEEGARLEGELLEIANRYGMRFLGPNCIGIINTEISLNATVIQMDQGQGSLGLASQSGTYVTQTLEFLHKKGITFSKAISAGNEANINIGDILEYLGEDEQTKAIILYIEGIREGQRLIKIAQKISPHKPILAQYVGGSTAGAKAGKSHTGAMAGPDILYEGIFKQAGIIRVHTVEELFTHGWVLANQPVPRGNRLGIVTNSGGPGTAMAHQAEMGGICLPTLTAETQALLRQKIPAHASAANPVDVTFDLDTNLIANEIPCILAASGEIDILAVHGVMQTAVLRRTLPHVQDLLVGISLDDLLVLHAAPSTEIIGKVAAELRRRGIPIVASSFFEQGDNFSDAFRANGVSVFDAPEKAALALCSLYRYSLIKQRGPIIENSPLAASEAARAIIAAAVANGQGGLDEFSAKRFLACYGIPTPRGGIAASTEEALLLAREIGYPVVVKGCAWEAMHKSEMGVVFVGISNPEELAAASAKITAKMGTQSQILVEKMVRGSRELMLGMTRFPGFGACVSFGLGGVLTEALADVTFRCAPLGVTEAREMLGDIRAKKILGEHRGARAIDPGALAAIICNFSQIASLHPEISEIDINPLIADGEGNLAAVDALVVLTPPA